MYQNVNALAELLFLLIKPIVLWRSRCRCRRRCLSSFGSLSNKDGNGDENAICIFDIKKKNSSDCVSSFLLQTLTLSVEIFRYFYNRDYKNNKSVVNSYGRCLLFVWVYILGTVKLVGYGYSRSRTIQSL